MNYPERAKADLLIRRSPVRVADSSTKRRLCNIRTMILMAFPQVTTSFQSGRVTTGPEMPKGPGESRTLIIRQAFHAVRVSLIRLLEISLCLSRHLA